jgi:hypothetical protein
MLNHNENLERLLDLIAEYLISSDIPNIKNEVRSSQKYIRDGKLQLGDTGGVLALFQKDIKANQEDLNNLTTLYPGTEQEEVIPTLLNIANSVDFNTLEVSSSIVVDNGLQIYLKGGGANFPDAGLPITQLLIGDNNPINLSQFIPLNQEQTNMI